MSTRPRKTRGNSSDPLPDRVLRGDDGVYRWIRSVSLWTHPLLPLTVLKVVLPCALLPALLVGVLGLTEGDGMSALRAAGTVAAIVVGIMVVLSVVAYVLTAWIRGGRYTVVFEMDDKEARHMQLPRDAEKAGLLGRVTAMAGTAAGQWSAAGSGLLAASHRVHVSTLSRVTRVRVLRRRDAVLLDQPLVKNQLYVAPEDMDRVLDHLRRQCPEARFRDG